jgi:DNA-directed RNA polymerase sigma subunit (sigma70/sigma32)
VTHPSFGRPGAEVEYGGSQAREEDFAKSHMPDDLTRECARRMHYAAYRMGKAGGAASRKNWHRRYLCWRNRIVVGNHKLIYQAVRRWKPPSCYADDMAGECRVVLIQAVAAYNPWLGVRFSTYAFTCLLRALSRLSQRYTGDPLSRCLPLGALPGGEPAGMAPDRCPDRCPKHIDVYLYGENPLLSAREKLVLRRRFRLDEQAEAETLQQLGDELGVSRERVRQVEAHALGKLRGALERGAATLGAVGPGK